MPTLIDLDAFAHQTAQTSQAGSGFIGTYDNIGRAAGVSFDTAVKRSSAHVCSLKIVEDGTTATNVRRNIAAGNRVIVASLYIRATAIPASTSALMQFAGPTNNGLVALVTGTGQIQSKIQTAAGRNSTAGICDGLWHRIDVKFDASGTTYTFDTYVDGVLTGTQCTLAGQTAADITSWAVGSLTNGDNATFWVSDLMISATGADFPIGPHLCLPLYPSGEGTETLGTTNKIQDEAAGQTNLYQKVDDWNGGTPDTSTYVTYASTTLGDAASNFAEFTMDDPISGIAVVDVMGYIAGFANGTGADTADTQVLTAHAGTLIDHIGNLIDYSGSTTVLGYYRQKLARPAGGWDATKLAAAVVQWGRSTDSNAIPRLSGVMLEYAATITEQSTTASPAATGALTASGTVEAVGSSSPAGTGAVTATGLVHVFGSGSPAGVGDLTATGLAHVFGASSPAAIAALVGTAIREALGSSSPAGTGALTATGLGEAAGSAAVSGAGALTADGDVIGGQAGSATIGAAGALVADALVTAFGSASLAGAGSAAAQALSEAFGAAGLSGAGALAGTGRRETLGAAELAGAAALAGAGLAEALGAALLEAIADATGLGTRETFGAAALAGTAELDGDGEVVTLGLKIELVQDQIDVSDVQRASA